MNLRRILIRSTNWLGDAVMTLPAVQRLRQAHPQAHFAVLTEPKLADLWRLHPDVAEVIVQERSDCPLDLLRTVRELRLRQFDAAVIFPNSWRSVLPVWLARVPRRVGFRGHNRAWMLTDVLEESGDYATRPVMPVEDIRKLGAGKPGSVTFRHHVHRHLELVARLGADATPCEPKLNVGAVKADEFPLPTDKPLLALSVGAEYGPAKRWPLDRFVAVAKAVAESQQVRWVLIGGPKDADLAGEAAQKIGSDAAINLAGQTTLGGLCRLLARCRLLLTNDSGPMHLAAAVGTPTVTVFGSTEPMLTGPSVTPGSRHVILRHQPPCSPCFLRECPIDFRCMTAVSAEEVVKAVCGALNVRATPQ
ncbi:MAG: lipopolysaccharide heptosyltransferase II [Verrucomicrobia bacterium]|nr:lipopolysaccharide heptosyltransferase II [Verrucomicrobiota bacterium]